MSQNKVIKIIAPSFPATSLESLEKAMHTLVEYGFSVLPPSTPKEKYSAYAGGTVERTNALIDEMGDPEIDILWAVRGGAGATQVVAELEQRNFVPTGKPKLLVGYSDITALIAWWEKHNWPVIHGLVAGTCQETFPLTGSAVNNKTSLQEVVKCIRRETAGSPYQLTSLYNPEGTQRIVAPITGGCITIVRELIGTPTQQETAGKILFLENFFENEPICLVREIYSLIRANLLRDAKALFLGEMRLKSSYLGQEECMPQLITELTDLFVAHGLQIPIVHSPEFGHGPINHPLPFSHRVELELRGKEATLLCSTSNITH